MAQSGIAINMELSIAESAQVMKIIEMPPDIRKMPAYVDWQPLYDSHVVATGLGMATPG